MYGKVTIIFKFKHDYIVILEWFNTFEMVTNLHLKKSNQVIRINLCNMSSFFVKLFELVLPTEQNYRLRFFV